MTLSPFSTTWRTDVVRKVNELRTDVTQLQADVAALQAEVAASQWFWADFLTMRSQVTDRVDLFNNFYGDPNDLLAYTSPSPKYVLNDAGVLVSGTTLRTDHDTAGNPLGLLNEPQGTNQIVRAEEISTTPWQLNAASVNINVATAPDGAMTADKLVENTATSGHNVRMLSIGYLASTTYTCSIFAKAGERSVFTILAYTNDVGGIRAAHFNLTTGTAAAGTTGLTGSQSITPYPNGWFRCVMTFTTTATIGTTRYVDFRLSSTPTPGPNGDGYTGDGASGLHLWGVQLEVGTFPSSYIKTEGSQVTRAADNITIPLASFPWNSGNGVLELNGVAVTPVTSGSNLSISGTAFAEGETHIESLTWQPLP